MIDRIDAIAGFEGHLANVDRIRQRIGEIERRFGIGGIAGQDFQTILNKELERIQAQITTDPVNDIRETSASQQAARVEDTTGEVEVFGADNTSSKTGAVTNKGTTQRPKTSSNTFPGEEALPSAINKAINPFAAVGSKPAGQNEKPDEEYLETPTRDAKRLSTTGGTSTEDMIYAAAEKYDVDPKLLRAIAIAESNMNQNDISDAGAIGVMQLMPETARGLGIDPYDEQQNIEGGAKYLNQMLGIFGGNVRKAVAAYNAGPGAVQQYGGIPPYGETQNYVGRVMDLYK